MSTNKLIISQKIFYKIQLVIEYRYNIPIDSNSVIIVTTMPGFKNSIKLILTPDFAADSSTIKFAIAPIIVALPANVDDEANANHNNLLLPCFNVGPKRITKGTLLTICENIRLTTCKMVIP